MKLVIVESPTKAKTIGKFLGSEFVVKASMGHVMDLPKSKLGVDTLNNFNPQFEISEGKKSTISELQKLASESDGVILASDPDREGEAIAYHISQLLREKLSAKKSKAKSAKNETSSSGIPFQRIVFHEITKDAIRNALEHPGVIDTHLVDAQTARRVLDRLVGYKLSPILWQKVRRGLSAGRVQSVALRLIVEREKEIEKFGKEPYWTITATLSKDKKEVEFELVSINDEKIEQQNSFQLYDGDYTVTKTTITTQEKADTILEALKKKEFVVSDVAKKETKRSPQPPFTTSTLQQQASQRFGFSGKRTMSLAQKLYEEGFITYHRTDSVHLAETSVTQMRDFVVKKFGESYVPEKVRLFSTKQKLAQEAHEAIRPTDVNKTEEYVRDSLGAAYAKIYQLIWSRALASQMADARVESTTVLVETKPVPEKYVFKTTGSILLFEGFLKVNPFGLSDRQLPDFVSGETIPTVQTIAIAHETPAPPRYNDASLIKSLEEEGIGRPSTYATIISVLEERTYVERKDGRFYPTAVGNAVNDFLVKYFSTIDDVPFTASMEDQLDEVAEGKKDWVPVIREFYTPFEKQLTEVSKTAERVQIATEDTGEICPLDGAPLVIRTGRFGKFISCKNFPTCEYKKAYVEETNFLCPKDGGKIIARKTKKGRTFYGCNNYPNCDFAVWKLSDIKKGVGNETDSAKKTTRKRTAKKTK